MDTEEKYHLITEKLIEKGITVAVMESVTSGTIASLITDTEGSSAVFRGGFVTYCNEAKIDCGVPEEIIGTFGVYSRETAGSMARACRERLGTDIGIGVTGTLANADPANADSIPGHVFFAVSRGKETKTFEIEVNEPERRAGKMAIADKAADELIRII